MSEHFDAADIALAVEAREAKYLAVVAKQTKELAEREKQNVLLRGFVKLLRDYIPASAIGNMTVQEALDATADLAGLMVCDAEEVAFFYEHNETGEVVLSRVLDDECIKRGWTATLLYRRKQP